MKNRTRNAVNRSAPFLLSLYSLIVVWFAIGNARSLTPSNAAPWYPKKHLTFSDLIANAKYDILGELYLPQADHSTGEFLLAPFPLNIVYGALFKKRKVA